MNSTNSDNNLLIILFLQIIFFIFLTTLGDLIIIYKSRTALILLVTIYISFSQGERWKALVIAGWGGLLQDLASPNWFGQNYIAQIITAFALNGMRHLILPSGKHIWFVIIFFAILFHDAIYFLFYVSHFGKSWVYYILNYTLPTAIYTVLIGMIFLIIKDYKKGKQKRYYGFHS